MKKTSLPAMLRDGVRVPKLQTGWVTTSINKVIEREIWPADLTGEEYITQYERDAIESDEVPLICLWFALPTADYSVGVTLTAMTSEELEAWIEFVNKSVDRARPIVAELDRRAQEAYENGNDAYGRLYRQVPGTYRRKRTKPQHSEGLRGGLEGVPDVDCGGA